MINLFSHRFSVRLATISLSLLLTFPVTAQQPVENGNGAATLTALRDQISALLDEPKFASSRWGVRIVTADDGDRETVIYERDADKAFIPASNMKLYTTSAALDAFGPDFRIKTSIYTHGTLTRRGTLRGDLTLYGRGDPNLSARFEGENPERYNELKPTDTIPAIERLADQIKALGVRTIIGDIIGDDSFFAGDPLGPGWEWDDAQFYYGAEVSALTVNDNVVTFTVTPGRIPGNKPVIKVQPQTGYVRIINRASTSSNGQRRIGIHRPLNSNTVEFFGTIPVKAAKLEVNIAIHEPALYAATLLKEALARRNIRHQGRIRHFDAQQRLEDPPDETRRRELASVESQPLSEMLKVINKQSQNLHTELMLRQLGARLVEPQEPDEYGRPKPTISLGNQVRKAFLEKAGIAIDSLNLRDGSGLARQNLVTPRSTSMLLKFMLHHQYAETFRESLVVAGEEGTLERRMRSTAAAGNFHGKTGTLSNVNALSGYVTTKGGQVLILSIMGNNYTGPGRDVTAVMDRICTMLAEFDGRE